MTTSPVTPSLTIWELTTRCNLHCRHCGSSAGTPRPNELSTKEAHTIITDLTSLGYQGITLMGGEIFLHPDWYELSTAIKNHGLTLSLVTNGAVPTDHLLPQLKTLRPDCLMVGLDAATPNVHDAIRGVQGAFDTTLRFIRAVRKQDIPIGIITTVQKTNFTQLPQLLTLVETEDIDWQIQEAVPIGRCPRSQILSAEEYYAVGLFIAAHQASGRIVGAHNFGFHSTRLPTLHPYPTWKGCYAGTTVLGITSTGDVKGCLTLPDTHIIGNIRQTPLSTLLNDPSIFMKGAYAKPPLGPNCRGCRHGHDCCGGCPTRSLSMTGVPGNDPFCFHRLERTMTP